MNSKLNFSLTQLEYVLAVHKHGSFAKAAKACFITQPTLSMQIQKLEESLETVIFDRGKKPILLTDRGKLLVDQMQSVLFEAKKIESIVTKRDSGSTSGELTLGIIPTVSPYLLPRLLPVLEKLYPQLRLKLYEMQTHKILEALQEDEIDVGLLATPLKEPKIYERPLYWEPFTVLCQKKHDLAKSKKIKHASLTHPDIWLLEEGHCLRSQVLDVCSTKPQKNKDRIYQFESGNLETLKNLVRTYGGYTLLPFLAAENLDESVTTVPFEKPIPVREIGLIHRREHHKKDLLDALGNAVLSSVPEALKKFRAKELERLPVEQS